MNGRCTGASVEPLVVFKNHIWQAKTLLQNFLKLRPTMCVCVLFFSYDICWSQSVVLIMGVRWRVEEILNFTRDCDETQFAWNWFWLCWDFYLKKGCEFVLAVVCSCYVVRILKIETVSVDSRRLPPNSCLRPPHNTKRVSHCKCEGYLGSKFHFNHCQNLHLSPFSLRPRSPEVLLESWGLSMESLELISISRAGNPHLAFLGVVFRDSGEDYFFLPIKTQNIAN